MEPVNLFVGRLRRDILLPVNGPPLIDVPGGDLLYAAAGFLIWGKDAGLLARVGEDYPRAWLKLFEDLGLNTKGIHILPEDMDLRNFLAYNDEFERQLTNPLAHFKRLGLPFPKILLGYQPTGQQKESLMENDASLPRPAEIPEEYLDARCVHLCAMEYTTVSRLISKFRDSHVTTMTVDPLAGWMEPTNWSEVCLILPGLTAFLPSEEEMRSLFIGKSTDLIEMTEALAGEGCELIVVKCGAQGQLLYETGSHKCTRIPAYAVEPRDATGVGASFCGGFMAGLHSTYDPLLAVLHGNISASLTMEGSGAFHILDSHPGLAQARLDSLKDAVRIL